MLLNVFVCLFISVFIILFNIMLIVIIEKVVILINVVVIVMFMLISVRFVFIVIVLMFVFNVVIYNKIKDCFWDVDFFLVGFRFSSIIWIFKLERMISVI